VRLYVISFPFTKNRSCPFASYVFKKFIIMMLIRIIMVLGLPNLFENAELKYSLLILGTVVIVIGLLLLLFYLLKFFKKSRFLFHNVGFAINFIFVLKEGLTLTVG